MRSESEPDPRQRASHRAFRAVLAMLLLAALAGAAAARLGSGDGPAGWAPLLDNLHWTAAYAAAALLAWRAAAEARDQSERAARRWFLGAMGLLLAGQVAFDLQVALDRLVFPAVSDAFFLAVGPFVAAGLWTLGRTRLDAARWRVARLDATTMLVAVLAAALALFLPRQGHFGALQLVVMSAYAAGLMAPVCLGLTLALALRVRFVAAALVLPLSVLAFAGLWVEWIVRLLEGRLGDGDWLNIGFSAVAVAIGIGIRIHRLDSAADPRWDRRCEALSRLLPLAMMVLAALGLLLVHSLPGVHPLVEASVAVGAVAVVVLAAMRQHLLLGERDRLIAAERLLRQREAELEGRVRERTQELARAKEAAEVASRAKSAFLANMSHEIRTPMNSVLGLAHVALTATREPVLRDHLGKIQASGRHLMGLIDDILDMSKIEAGRLELERLPFRLAEVVEGLELQLAERARAKGLELRIELEPALAATTLVGDPLRLGQVLLNLAGNAIKFTDAGSVTITARRAEGAGRAAAGAAGDLLLRFEVADTGAGIGEEARSRLFQLFQQGDASTTRRHGGTGLGLAISRQLVEMMGGEIGVDSRSDSRGDSGAPGHPGCGSRFWFTVRLGLAPAGAAPAAGAAAGHPSLQGARILVVEDNEVNQVVATAMLQTQGASVAVARDGEEALAQLRTTPFDCVLMDVQMPVMDGLEATRSIRADPALAGVRVIGMTANAWEEDRERCLAAGMDAFTTKPIEPGELYAAVARVLAREPDLIRRPPPPAAAP